MARKAKVSKEGKAESITVRLDPKIRYGLELLARKQRRTLSSVVEWALHKAIYDPSDGLYDAQGEDLNLLSFLWDVHEADRLYQLATCRPALLNFEEEALIKVVSESDYFAYLSEQFKHLCDKETGNLTPAYHQKMRESLREHHAVFKKIAEGELGKDALPKPPRGWQKQIKAGE